MPPLRELAPQRWLLRRRRDGRAGFRECSGGGEAGEAGADDGDVGLLGKSRGAGLGCATVLSQNSRDR